ncbi:hypothetical protein FDB42_17550 [Clostridium botulinum]|nr:hypothetical protein [Clostridium botulinum]
MLENLKLNISVDSLIKIITVLITVISTYLVAKYNSNTPRKLEIKQKQFEKVYLPIYKILLPDLGYNIEKSIAIDYVNKIHPILWDNYEFAYPQLHKLFNDFTFSLDLNDDYQEIFNKICYQVKLDYDLLKKSLGYPSESFLGIFIRMNIDDKFNEIFGWVNIFFLLNPIILIFTDKIPFVNQNYLKLVLFNYLFLSILLFWEAHINKVPIFFKHKQK